MSERKPHGGFRRVVSDVLDLCDLQWQLLAIDGQVAKRLAVCAALCFTAAMVVGFAGVVTILIGAGFTIHEQYGVSPGQSFLLISSVALAVALLIGLVAVKLLAKANESLTETKREFGENVRWIRSVVMRPDTSPRNQIRREDFCPAPPMRRAAPATRFTR